MALTPGLTSFKEDAPDVGGRNDGRVVPREPNMEAPRLRPVAAPVNTYARPAQPPIDNNLQNLAQALSQLNPALQAFAAVQNDPRKKEADAKSKLAAMTDDQIREGLKNGSINVSDKFEAGVAGERRAFARMRELQQEMLASPDPKNFDIDGRLAQAQQEDIATLGGNTLGQQPYLNVMSRARAQLMEARNNIQTQQKVEDRQQGVFERFTGTIDILLNENKTPEQINSAIRKMYTENKLGLQVGNENQDQELVRAARKYAAEGKYDLVKALLESDRTGENGQNLGSIASKGKFVNETRQILEMAEREQRQANAKTSLDDKLKFQDSAEKGQLDEKALLEDHKKNPGKYSNERVETLVRLNKAKIAEDKAAIEELSQKAELYRRAEDSRQDSLVNGMKVANSGLLAHIRGAKVFNEKGEIVEETAEERKKAVVQRFLEDKDRELSIKPDDPKLQEKVFNDKALWFAKNGIENPQWKATLTAGAMTPSAALLSPGDPPPPALEDGYNTYTQLKTKAPALLKKHIGQKEEDLYEAMRIARTSMGMNKEQSYGYALKILQTGSDADDALTRQTYENVRTKINDPGNQFWGSSGARNNTQVKEDMLRMTRLYLRAGLNEDDAIKEAEKRYASNNVVVNGWWVPVTQKDVSVRQSDGKFYQRPFKEVAEGYVRSWTKEYEKWLTSSNINPKEVSMMPVANSANEYLLIGRDGIPMVDSTGKSFRFSLGDMIQRLSFKDDIKREREVGKIMEKATNPRNMEILGFPTP